MGLLRFFVHRAAGRYSAGPELSDALAAVSAVRVRGWAATICPWNDSSDDPQLLHAKYLAALEGISRVGDGCSLSIKIPGLHYDPGRIREIFSRARDRHLQVHLDAPDPESVAATFAAVERTGSDLSHVGCTLPARYSRSIGDAAWAIERQLAVRIVKGQWSDRTVAELDLRKQFLRILELTAEKVPRVGIATHDQTLARECFGQLKRATGKFELEQLYGLPPIAGRLADFNPPIRLYVPYDRRFLPYSASDALYRPQIAARLLGDIVAGRPRFPSN